MMKKGLTPIIAIILLLLMTVMAGAATMLWVQRLQTTLASQTEQQIAGTMYKMGISVNIVDIYYDSGSNNVTVIFSNDGTVPLNLSEFLLVISSYDAATGTETFVTSCDLGSTSVSSSITGCTKEDIRSGDTCVLKVNLSTCDPAATLSSGTYVGVLTGMNTEDRATFQVS